MYTRIVNLEATKIFKMKYNTKMWPQVGECAEERLPLTRLIQVWQIQSYFE